MSFDANKCAVYHVIRIVVKSEIRKLFKCIKYSFFLLSITASSWKQTILLCRMPYQAVIVNAIKLSFSLDLICPSMWILMIIAWLNKASMSCNIFCAFLFSSGKYKIYCILQSISSRFLEKRFFICERNQFVRSNKLLLWSAEVFFFSIKSRNDSIIYYSFLVFSDMVWWFLLNIFNVIWNIM